MSWDRRRPEAVLWDLDGTLIDSEPIYIEVADALVRAAGGRLSDQVKRDLVARPMDDLVDAVLQADPKNQVDGDRADGGDRIRARDQAKPRDQIDARTRAELAQVINAGVMERLAGQAPWRPGARQALAELHRSGCPLGLATLSFRDYVDLVLADLGFNPFGAIVAGDEAGLRPKPDPDPYLRLARRLSVDPARCLVLEDSVIGVQAGRAAGAQVIALHAEEAAARQLADRVWPSLLGRTPADFDLTGPPD
ncbi:MAG: HAD family phosphatase [Propionibacteriaceae bacterium]|nr:HAD family phosphatase [Propionibacteriaceae bacterium]